MAISHSKKETLVAELGEILSTFKVAAFAEYSGLTVAEIQELRRIAREQGVIIKVVKNRLVKVAMSQNETLKDTDTSLLKGQVLYAISDEDEVLPAKILADFAEKHPEVVKAFAKSAIDAQQPYIANPDAWLKQPENISKLARLSGVPEGDVPGLVKGNTYLTPQQQTAELTGPVNKAIIDTAQFLKEQGKVPAVANDYSQYVTSRFVQ